MGPAEGETTSLETSDSAGGHVGLWDDSGEFKAELHRSFKPAPEETLSSGSRPVPPSMSSQSAGSADLVCRSEEERSDSVQTLVKLHGDDSKKGHLIMAHDLTVLKVSRQKKHILILYFNPAATLASKLLIISKS